jgi:hypothetical protein
MTDSSDQPPDLETAPQPRPADPAQPATDPPPRAADTPPPAAVQSRTNRKAVLIVGAAAAVLGAVIFAAGLALGVFLGGDGEGHGGYEHRGEYSSQDRGGDQADSPDNPDQPAPEKPRDSERQPGR